MIKIGLINNMPGGAHKTATRQFGALLAGAEGASHVALRSFSPISVCGGAIRGGAGCAPLHDIFDAGLDALIVTGAEPSTFDLHDEPFWPDLTRILDWADREGLPVMLSCLAAHVAVQHTSGITRRSLAGKCFGVFAESTCGHHPLTDGLPDVIRIPHSRWNELPTEELVAAGYRILTRSRGAGVDAFTHARHENWIFFQGHPEYDPDRLLLEYRRDVRRFLAGERAAYPSLPHAYFDPADEARLTAFRDEATSARVQSRAVEFPADIAAPAHCAWRPAATTMVANWLAGFTGRRQ